MDHHGEKLKLSNWLIKSVSLFLVASLGRDVARLAPWEPVHVDQGILPDTAGFRVADRVLQYGKCTSLLTV